MPSERHMALTLMMTTTIGHLRTNPQNPTQ
ncbi:hypothetical protein MMUC44124_28925 [Mycolicibacterium mucogenicum DSM 44124]|nr:hypothetical protein MMUC44124_28925 [Mycolicibacterium mucogenicum DSM 44124]